MTLAASAIGINARASGAFGQRRRPRLWSPPRYSAPALVLLPIGFTVIQATGVSAQDAVDLLVRPLVGRLLFNTIGLIVAASATCAVIGAAAAWLVERTDLPGRKVWGVLAVAPSPSRRSYRASPGCR